MAKGCLLAEIAVAFHPEARAEYLEALERYLELSERVDGAFSMKWTAALS